MLDKLAKPAHPAHKWAKRAGISAFLLFLAKGLLWLGAIIAGAYYTLN